MRINKIGKRDRREEVKTLFPGHEGFISCVFSSFSPYDQCSFIFPWNYEAMFEQFVHKNVLLTLKMSSPESVQRAPL